MTKKVTLKKKKATPTKCCVAGCKRFSCVMRRNAGEVEHYCGPHWLSEVEAKRPSAYKEKKWPKYEDTLKAAKKKIVKKKVKK